MTKYRHRISIQQVRIYFISSDLFGHCVQDRVFNLKIRTMFPFSDTTVFMISILIWSDKRYVLRQSTNQRHLKGCSNLCFCTVSYTRFLQMAKGPRPYLGPTCTEKKPIKSPYLACFLWKELYMQMLKSQHWYYRS